MVPKRGSVIGLIMATGVIATIVAITLANTRPTPATSDWRSDWQIPAGLPAVTALMPILEHPWARDEVAGVIESNGFRAIHSAEVGA